MKNRKRRVECIVDIIKNNCISSQDELIKILADSGFKVTQATLSRDLKMLKTTKVPTDRGTYMYMLPDNNVVKDKMLSSGTADFAPHYQAGFISLEFSGNIAVIKTRNGYAPGLGYDIDRTNTPEIVGTLAGTDTIMVVLREGVTQERAREVFARFLPIDEKIPIY